jgi:manganese transport system substrate-binding protein
MIPMFSSRGIVLMVSVTLGLGLMSCTSAEVTDPSTQTDNRQTRELAADNQGKKKVLTTFTVLADIAQNVAGDKLDVQSITRIGAEIHGYEPTPSDITKAQDADLILYNGMNLERWFEQFLGNVKDVPSVLLTEGIEPIPIAEGPYADKPNPPCLDVPEKRFSLCREYSSSVCGTRPRQRRDLQRQCGGLQ